MSLNKALLSEIMKNLEKSRGFRRPHNQWQDPGEITQIPSRNITMEGVGFPVLGVGGDGYAQMMYPGMHYKFPVGPVTEYPMMQMGGHLKKAQIGLNNIRANRISNVAESTALPRGMDPRVAAAIQQDRSRVEFERMMANQPILQPAKKPIDSESTKRKNKAYAAKMGLRYDENTGEVSPLLSPQTAKTIGRIEDNLIIPMLEMEMIASGAPFVRGALNNLGKYATEQTFLRNTHRINPWAYRGQPDMMYRGIGRDGLEDALESGLFRAKQNVQPVYSQGNRGLLLSKQFGAPFFTPKFRTADSYGGGFIAEVPKAASSWKSRYKNSDWSQWSTKDIPVLDGRIMKRHWLKGYEEMPNVYSDINKLNEKNFADLIDVEGDLSHGLGFFNYGVYPFKKDPRYVVKLDNVAKWKANVDPSAQVMTDIPQMMKDVNQMNVARMIRDIDFTGKRLPVPHPEYNMLQPYNDPSYSIAGRVMNRVDGKPLSNLAKEEISQIPTSSYQKLFDDVRMLHKQNLGLDFVGDNLFYNPSNKQFGLLDIGKIPTDRSQAVFSFANNQFDLDNAKWAVMRKLGDRLQNMVQNASDPYKYISQLQPIIDDVGRNLTNVKKFGGPFKRFRMDEGGEAIDPPLKPVFKTFEDREAYKKRLKAAAEKALSQPDNSYLLRATNYHDIESGNNCINGVCGLNIEAGLTFNKPSDVDRYLSGEKFAQAVAKGKEDYYKASGNFQIGDIMQYRHRSKPDSHNKIIYDIVEDNDGNKIYKVIHNAGSTKMTSQDFTEEELRKIRTEGEKGYDFIDFYRPGYSIDRPALEKERATKNMSPEAIAALGERKRMNAYEVGMDPNYTYSVREDSPHAKDVPTGMQKFVDFANKKENIDDLVNKLGVSKSMVHDELLNTFGELGQENKWEDRTFGGRGYLENTVEKIFKPKTMSIGPGQIKFNQVPDDLKKMFGIKKAKDLFDWDKVLPLMTAINIRNRQFLERKAERGELGDYLTGEKNLNASNIKYGLGRFTPYMYRGMMDKSMQKLRKEAEEEISAYRMSPEDREASIQNYIDERFAEKARYLGEGSYARKVKDNIDQNLQRIMPEADPRGMILPNVKIVGRRYESGGEMIRRADGSYSRRGLWDNIRANKGSGKKPTKEMLEQERKIRAQEKQFGGTLISDNMYMYNNPFLMQNGGEPDGAMAIGQIDAAIDKLMNLRKFIQPDTDLEPWVSSKLTLMDHYTDAVSDYIQYNPEAQEEGLMEMAQGGGIPQRYKNMGFSKTGAKKKSNRPGKKWMVLAKKGDQYKVVHGGYKGMQDYTQHGSSQRRENFWNRMGGKNSAKAKDPFSPLYWHKRFGTWQDGGEINDELPEVERFKRIKTPPVPIPYSNEYVGDITNRYNDFYAKMYNVPIPFAPSTQRDDGFDAFVYDAPHETPPSRLVVKMLADKYNKQQQNMSRWDTYKGGGYIGYDGKRHVSKTPTWSGVMGYDKGGEIPNPQDYEDFDTYKQALTEWEMARSAPQISSADESEMMRIIEEENYMRRAAEQQAFNAQNKSVATPTSSTAYSGDSIVDMLKSMGEASDFQSRKKLAEVHGITNYRGTADQNLELLGILRGGQTIPAQRRSASAKTTPQNKTRASKPSSKVTNAYVPPPGPSAPYIIPNYKSKYDGMPYEPEAPSAPYIIPGYTSRFDGLPNIPGIEIYQSNARPYAPDTSAQSSNASVSDWALNNPLAAFKLYRKLRNSDNRLFENLSHLRSYLPNKSKGGYVSGDILDITPEQADMLRAAGYEFEIIEP